MLVCASVFTRLFSSFYVFEKLEYQEKKDALLKQQKLITQSQAIIVPQYIIDNNEEAITLALSGVLSNPIIVGIAIYDPDGNILHRFGDFQSKSYQLFEARHDVTMFDGASVRRLGTLLTVSTERHIVANLQQQRRFYALVFAALFFAIVVAVYASIHSIVAIPLNRLVLAIKETKNGKPISVNWSGKDEIGLLITEFENLQGRQFRAQLQLRDELDHRGEMLAELLVMKEAAEQASHAKSEFMAAMSHELRTPLNAIIGFSEMIKDELLGPIENEDYRNYSADINSSGRNLLAIINDILDIARIEAGSTSLDEALMDPVHTAQLTIKLISGRPEAEGLDISIQHDNPVPSLYADARAVEQILINLLSNAVKFTDKGSVTVKIAAASDGYMAIMVSDTGIGIPADKIGNLTQPFYQADSSLSRKFDGTGLGLALSKSLMELHDGELLIESVEGEGTKVICRFPPERIEPDANRSNIVA